MNIKTSTKIDELYQAVLFLKSVDDCRRFFRDLLTQPEIDEFANRWRVAQMLNQSVPYEIISKETGMSSTTIARVSKWLNQGTGGYKLILSRLHHTHKNKSARLREDYRGT